MTKASWYTKCPLCFYEQHKDDCLLKWIEDYYEQAWNEKFGELDEA